MAAQNIKPQKSPFAKLFSSDAQADKHLEKIRDKIYSFAWSRDRRDDAKLDWVLSENGVNRNVPLEWLRDAPSGSKRHNIDALPCWLHLVNKRISADFIRFIYSVNDLDVLVDLKANDTELNSAKLEKIVDLLQNVNFQRYTRSARVRIHFPDKYPFQDLPALNQHTLDNIARALDGFHRLTHLSVRVVPMQGPEDYELRLAAFPFYPMSMTNWTIRILNSNTYNWDLVAGEQIHHLNLAWNLFQEDGSLTATVHTPTVSEKSAIHNDRTLEAKDANNVGKNLEGGQKKNGSQKRKGRKSRALSAATAPTASRTTSETLSADLSLRPITPSLHTLKDARSVSAPVHDSGSGAEPSQTKSSSTTEVPLGLAGETPGTVSSTYDTAAVAGQRVPSSSLSKPESTSPAEFNHAPEVSDVAVESENTAEQDPSPASLVEAVPDESLSEQRPQEASPPSSAPSSVTLGRDQSDDENEAHDTVQESSQVETALRGAGAGSEKPARKKRKNRKKGKKTQSTGTTDISASSIQSSGDSGQQNPAETENTIHAFYIRSDSADGIVAEERDWEGLFSNRRTLPLSEIAELKPMPDNPQLLQYTKTNGKRGVLVRNSDLDRILRQKERLAAGEAERQAEKMRAKGKRKNKKVKEVMIRRKEPSDGLRRILEDTKRQAASNQGSELRKRLNEITGEGSEKPVPDFQDNSTEETDSSGFSSDDTPSSPEQPYGLLVRSSHPGRSSVSYRAPPMGEQRLIEEVEDSDDDASVVRQYSDEGPPSISDAESQSTAA